MGSDTGDNSRITTKKGWSGHRNQNTSVALLIIMQLRLIVTFCAAAAFGGGSYLSGPLSRKADELMKTLAKNSVVNGVTRKHNTGLKDNGEVYSASGKPVQNRRLFL